MTDQVGPKHLQNSYKIMSLSLIAHHNYIEDTPAKNTTHMP